MTIFGNILGFFTNPFDEKNSKVFFLFIVTILILLLLRQCESANSALGEIQRLENNKKAAADTLKHYKDKLGNTVGEIRGLTLTLDELKEENSELEIKANKPPITIIEYKTVVVEKIVEVPVYIKDTPIIQIIMGDTLKFDSSAVFAVNDTFGKSSRSINATIPYKVDTSLVFGNATIDLKQNIWLSAGVFQDKKTKEVFVELKSDYPGITFNDTKGIMIDRKSKQFRKFNMKQRKSFGVGINVGYGYSPFTNSFLPYVGIGIQYTPKFLQW